MIKLCYKPTSSSVPKVRPKYFITNILMYFSLDLIRKDLFFLNCRTQMQCCACFFIASFSLHRTVHMLFFKVLIASMHQLILHLRKSFVSSSPIAFILGLQVIVFNCISDALFKIELIHVTFWCNSAVQAFVSSGVASSAGQV